MNFLFPTVRVTALALALLGVNLAAVPLDSWTQLPSDDFVELRQTKSATGGSLTFTTPDARTRTLRLSVADFFGDVVRVTGSFRLLNPGQRAILSLDSITGSHPLADLRQGTEWQTFNGRIPPGISTGATQLRLVIMGEGSFEFTNLRSLTRAEDQPLAEAASDRAGWYARFFQGTDPTSSGWTTWTGSGQIKHAFDLQNRRDGTRSIVLSSVGGEAYGATAATWENPAKRFRITGHARATGIMSECVVAIQFFGPDWQKLSWFTINEVPATGEWHKIDAVAESPEGTVRAALTLIFKGEGSLWLDEPLITVE